ncbi:MAG: hypothetical protein AAF961_16355, partial [Planctomycetota bacterium]
ADICRNVIALLPDDARQQIARKARAEQGRRSTERSMAYLAYNLRTASASDIEAPSPAESPVPWGLRAPSVFQRIAV